MTTGKAKTKAAPKPPDVQLTISRLSDGSVLFVRMYGGTVLDSFQLTAIEAENVAKYCAEIVRDTK